MEQTDVSQFGATEGIGVLISDSAMYQRAQPTVRDCAAPDDSDPTRPNALEISTFGDFFGLTTPLIKRGIPVDVPVLDVALRSPGYLDKYKILVLSYEFQKPSTPGLHAILADWVNRGGILIYVGAETDAFHRAADWWNRGNGTSPIYASPGAHLTASLGLGENPESGRYRFGSGWVFVDRVRPAFYNRSQENADVYRRLIADAAQLCGVDYAERNYFLKRRGPYLLAATLTESLSDAPLELSGRFVDLFDPELKVVDAISVESGERAWLLDLDRATVAAPAPLASSLRVEKIETRENSVVVEGTSPAGINAISLFKLENEPAEIVVDGRELDAWRWDATTKTLFFAFPSSGRAAVEFRGVATRD